MSKYNDSPSENQQNVTPQADLSIRLPGDNHLVSADVLFAHLRMACKDVTFKGGYVDITIDHDGRVYVEKRLIFTPKALQVKEGAA